MELPFRVVSAGVADIGRGRKHNEDTVLLRPDFHLFLLADGAGGHEAGNVASALATTTIAHYFEATEKVHEDRPEFDTFGLPTAARRLSAAIHHANKEIAEVAKASNRHRGMGTTIVAAWLEPRTQLLHVAHVGDSRCYRLRDGALEAMTQDHSLINEVLEMRPELDDDVLAKLPRHVITRALGMADAPRVTLKSIVPRPGDKYLLSSDGLHAYLAEAHIAEALALERTPEDQVNLLIEMAKDAGSRDNISVVIIDCEPLPPMLAQPMPVPSPERANAMKSQPLPPMPAVNDDSTPEIVILEEMSAESDLADHVHVLPLETKNQGIVAAMDGFIGPMRPRPRKPS